MTQPQQQIKHSMSLRSQQILSIGECMIELARQTDGRFGLAFGGDTFNTAVYLARLGANIHYLTALGSDPYSREILQLAHDEGVSTTHIQVAEGRSAGLYLIETDNGERSFWYWRENSPARDIFCGAGLAKALAAIQDASIIYFSGITLSLYADSGLDEFENALRRAKSRGARIIMDSNYRPRGWQIEKHSTQHIFERFWSLADIALPTFDDEQLLWDDQTADATIQRLSALGVGEICVKLGSDGARVTADGTDHHIHTEMIPNPVDTTAAGDSFNAGYLAARLNGHSAQDAVAIAHRLAGIVVSHRGAIAPRAVTDEISV